MTDLKGQCIRAAHQDQPNQISLSTSAQRQTASAETYSRQIFRSRSFSNNVPTTGFAKALQQVGRWDTPIAQFFRVQRLADNSGS
jgi:hypothetical protein